MKQGRVTGLEPANGGTTTHCLNHLATPAKFSFARLYQIIPSSVYIFIETIKHIDKIELDGETKMEKNNY